MKTAPTGAVFLLSNFENGFEMKSIIVLLAITVTGCAQLQHGALPEVHELPTKERSFFVECSGPANNISACYEAASNVCAKGYDVIDKVDTVTGGGTRKLTFKCK
jgi:hypothetical protein